MGSISSLVKEDQEYQTELKNSKELLEVLDLYVVIYNNLTAIEPNLHVGFYEEAISNLKVAKEKLDTMIDALDDIPEVVKLLRSVYNKNKSIIITRLQQLLSKCISININMIKVNASSRGTWLFFFFIKLGPSGHSHGDHEVSLHQLWTYFKEMSIPQPSRLHWI